MKKVLLSIFAMGAAVYAGAQAQPPNADMENWSSVFTEAQDPTSWISANVFQIYSATNPTSVVQGAPFTGTHSAQITTIKLASNPASGTIPDTLGVLLNGTVGFSSPYLKPGTPYVSRPATMAFAAKYLPMGSDSAYVDITLSKYTTSRQIISFTHHGILNVSSFVVQNVTLNYQNMTTFPDSITITFNASGGLHNHHLGSVLYVDDISLSGTNGIEEYTNKVGFSTYPNPANTDMTLLTEASKVELVNICDLTGRVVETVKVTSNKTHVSTESLTPGMYVYNALSSTGELMARGKFSVVK